MRKTLLATAALLSAMSAQAGISVPSTAFTYTQNFDSLTTATTASTWTNDTTLVGWNLFIASGAAAPTILGGTGSSTTGSFFSFGAASAPDRALGGLGSGGAYFGSVAAGSLAGWLAVSFSNDTGVSLAGFTIGFDGEQWRDGGAASPSAQSMVLQYGFGNSFGTVGTWVTPGSSFNWSSPVITNLTSGAAIDGNVGGKVTGVGGSVATSWAAGTTLWVRWVENNDLGNDHGLAIDNLSFSVTAVPEPGNLALLLAGLVAVGFMARRRA